MILWERKKHFREKNKNPETVRRDYNRCQMTWDARIWCVGRALLICACLNYFCYRSWWAIPVLLPLGVYSIWQCRKDLIKKNKQQMNYQFGAALQSLDTAVRAGYSMENAVRECRKDLQRIYGSNSDLVRELAYMETQMEVGISVETLFLDLGERSHLEDIRNFGEVFSIAKRTGGNLAQILEHTSRVLGEKIRIKQEIDVSIAGKRMEQTIMSLVPGAMILYMQISSGSFLNVLYHNTAGVVVMTGCLAVYLFGWRMGKKIVDIEV